MCSRGVHCLFICSFSGSALVLGRAQTCMTRKFLQYTVPRALWIPETKKGPKLSRSRWSFCENLIFTAALSFIQFGIPAFPGVFILLFSFLAWSYWIFLHNLIMFYSNRQKVGHVNEKILLNIASSMQHSSVDLSTISGSRHRSKLISSWKATQKLAVWLWGTDDTMCVRRWIRARHASIALADRCCSWCMPHHLRSNSDTRRHPIYVRCAMLDVESTMMMMMMTERVHFPTDLCAFICICLLVVWWEICHHYTFYYLFFSTFFLSSLRIRTSLGLTL